jgi:hypothetical protein
MRIMSFVERLKQIFTRTRASGKRSRDSERRSDPPFGGLRNKDVGDLPPERAAELAGHAPERVDT